jgi:hypothetical protein
VGDQRAQNADMGEAAGGAAAERKPNDRPPDTIQAYFVGIIRLALAASDQHIEHAKLSPEPSSPKRRIDAPHQPFMHILVNRLIPDHLTPPESSRSTVHAVCEKARQDL